ncbi:ExeM/NucH family extracellular endonuclease [Deinococcus sp.]|uniref:ExeM/NucH family extracellular endonuclease n=1 Tax=Deinococcus sp. TaxID=47478 RepID=UPI003CC6B42F
MTVPPLSFAKLALPLVTALLLAACGQNQTASQPTPAPVVAAPVPITPVPAKPVAVQGQVYEIRFQNVGSASTLTATARLVSPALGTQALTGLPDAALTLTPKATDTFLVGGVRHIKAVFTIKNNTAQAIDHLSFVPVDTATSGPQPTPAPVPTVGTTYFKNLLNFGGASADTRAGDLTPVSGKLLDVATGTPVSDPAATPYVPLDTSAVSPSAEPGLSIVSKASSAWRATNLLQPGASTNMTFSVDLVTQSSTTDPFEFSVVVSAADDIDTTPITAIHSIQGNGNTSPLAGQTVTTQGIVTADFEGANQIKGYFIQAPDAEADSDPATSEGVFVYCNAACPGVSVGDLVRLTGTVTEFGTGNPVTEITGVTTLQKRGSSTPLPTAINVALPTNATEAAAFDWERYEGMRVHVSGVVSENYKLGRGNTVKISDSRLNSYTVNNAPSVSGNAAWVAEIAKRLVSIDDGSTAQNLEPVFGRSNAPLSASNTLRTGDSADVTGVVHYGFDYTGTPDTYRIETTPADATFSAANPRPAAPALSGNLSVAGANVLNFFITLDGTAATTNTCSAGGVNTKNDARGANTCQEYQRQLDKVVSNLAGLNADVIGLMEVQNSAYLTPGTSTPAFSGDALQTLVDALNARLGGTVYQAISNPNTGTDAITVAMIYKPASVTPVGAAFNDTDPINNRLPLAQVFQATGGSKFAVVVNHLKSKGSAADSAAGNQDNADGQGYSALQREKQVARLLDLIQNKIVVGRGIQNVISVGDYNAYPMEPSLVNLRKGLDGAAGSADDLSPVFPDSSYSYQFDAQFGSLDHAFVTQSMKALLAGGEGVGYAKWHDNSDEPTTLDYNTEFKSAAQIASYYDNSAYRSSDHDPLKVAFNLPTLSALSVTASTDTGSSDTPAPNQPYTLKLNTTGSPDSASIDWGDGSSDTVAIASNAASKSHTYTTAGSKTINVTVTRNADGGSATGSKTITVTAPSLILTGQSVTSASVTAGQVLSPAVSATFNVVNAQPVSYSATVTDGATSQPSGGVTVGLPANTTVNGSVTVSPTLTGVTPGSYTVTLTASGQGGTSASATYSVTVTAAPVGVGKLVISQVYPGGGGSGATATYKTDYAVLFNAGTAPIGLGGKSLQYGSATGTTNFSGVFMLDGSVTLQPGQSYLIRVGPAATTNPSGADLTGYNADASSFGMGAGGGKLALVNGTAAISHTVAATNLLDLVGWGNATNANAYEGTVLAAPAVNQMGARKNGGCTDTNNNAADFELLTPAPKNLASALTPCP